MKSVTLSCDDGQEYRLSAIMDPTTSFGTAPAMMDFLLLDCHKELRRQSVPSHEDL